MAVSESNIAAKKNEVIHSYEMYTFHQKSHFWGRLTIGLVIVLTISLPLYLSFVLGIHPGWQPIITGLIAYAAAIGYAWFMEPISYYPTLGISGTYQAFLTGNIANMCLPSAAAAQNAVGAEPGTKKGEIVAALAIGATSLMNMAILIFIIVSGSYLVSIIPESIQGTFIYIVPAIFGGIFAQFALKKPLYGGIALSVGLFVNLIPIPTFFKGIICIILTIIICISLEKRK
ncbi:MULTISPECIES: small-conductance mechanosensitive channel [Cytobacillus]|nr:small-conductance mechanosensitive channel [Cytobacillus kochii]